MNIEIEKKFKIENKKTIRDKIIKLGGKSEGVVSSEDFYFKIPQKIKKTKYLRIRIKNNNKEGLLAYHKVINNIETKEWEVEVGNADITKTIFEKLGFEKDVVVIKKREIFKLGNCEIVLDTVKDLGNFIEIEAQNIKSMDFIINKLYLKNKHLISGAGYPDLIKAKNV